jgi:retron-type reverse transcriptase
VEHELRTETAEVSQSNGKTRLLGIPTVIDRMLQQAVSQVIMTRFEIEFKPHSYGFRPNRNAQQAVQQAQAYMNGGYQHIVDIDLKNFFDEVDHCKLMQLLYNKVKCPITLRLVRKWLRAPKAAYAGLSTLKYWDTNLFPYSSRV